MQELKGAKKHEEAELESQESTLLSTLQASQMVEEKTDVGGTIWDTPEEREHQHNNETTGNGMAHKKM